MESESEILRKSLGEAARRFESTGIGERGGRDPVAELYAARRRAFSLFSLQLADADCEALRPYLFGRPIPRKPGDPPVTCLNLVDGEWRRPAELVARASLADRRVTLFELARSRESDCAFAVDPSPRLLGVARVGARRARLPQAGHQELLAPAPVLLRGVPRRAAPADAEDPPRGRQGLLRGRSARPITSRATPRRRCGARSSPP